VGGERAWNMHKAALNGSSRYAILRWFTANIGVRHVRHFSISHFRGNLGKSSPC
jgi:hypothetical protein